MLHAIAYLLFVLGQASALDWRPPRFHDCVPWGSRVRHDPEWPTLADAVYNPKEEQVFVILGTSERSWRYYWRKNKHLRQEWKFQAQQGGHVIQCTHTGIDYHVSIIACPASLREGKFDFVITSHEGTTKTYKGVYTCNPPLSTPHRLTMTAILTPKYLTRFWLVPWVLVHRRLGVEAHVLYVTLDRDDHDYKLTWDQAFPPSKQKELLELFKDLPNVIFVPWTLSSLDPPKTFGSQLPHVAHALYTNKGVVDWYISADIDEYFEPLGQYSSLTQIIDKFDVSPASALKGWWLRFGYKNPTKDVFNVTGTVLDCAVHSTTYTFMHTKYEAGKMIINTARTTGPYIHHLTGPKDKLRIMNERTELRVNHYRHGCFCKSESCSVQDNRLLQEAQLGVGLKPCMIEGTCPLPQLAGLQP